MTESKIELSEDDRGSDSDKNEYNSNHFFGKKV